MVELYHAGPVPVEVTLVTEEHVIEDVKRKVRSKLYPRIEHIVILSCAANSAYMLDYLRNFRS
jgi:uncharacterized protein (DUF169 family)